MNELEQLMAEAITAAASLGATMGGFLGTLSQAELQARMDTRTEALNLYTQIASEYEPSAEKTAALSALNDLIAVFPNGG